MLIFYDYRELGILDRRLWLLVVVAFLTVAAAITKNFWSQWRNEQVWMKPLVAGTWSETKKMFLGGSFLKLADDDV